MSRRELTTSEIDQLGNTLSGWEIREGKLYKQFKFGTFAEAIGWMVSVGHHAERLDHHPDWCNSYNRVSVELFTHDLGALSTLDVELAARMDRLFYRH